MDDAAENVDEIENSAPASKEKFTRVSAITIPFSVPSHLKM